jgi:hypothetical protein
LLAAGAVALAAGTAALAAGTRARANPHHWHLPERLTWYWQLQGRVDHSEPAVAYDVDGFDTSAAEVAALHADGKRVICYIDVGTWENWRSDAGEFPRSVLGRPDGWPGERWLDIRALSVLEPIMSARFKLCAQKRFDAVEPDNIEAVGNDTGFPITLAEQLRYAEWIAREAHRLGLAVLQKNDSEQAAALEPYFDGALVEQCNQYRECAAYMAYLKADKPVLNAEYQRSLYPRFCAADQRLGIMGALYNLALDGATYRPCWASASELDAPGV